MNKKKRKLKWKNVIIILIVTALIITLIISIFNIVKWILIKLTKKLQIFKKI